MLKNNKVSTNIVENEAEDNQDTCPELTMVEENNIHQKVQDLQKAGAFNSTHGMMKLMNGLNGGGFYAAFIQDSASKKGKIGIVIEYPDGTCTDFIFVDQHKYALIESPAVQKTPSKPPKGIPYLSMDPVPQGADLSVYRTPDMPIPTATIWHLVYEKYSQLPIRVVHETRSIDEVYLMIATVCDDFAKDADLRYMHENGYYNIDGKTLEDIAQAYGYTRNKLVTSLELCGLLYKDSGGTSYQHSRRINGARVRFYSIKDHLDTSCIKSSVNDGVLDYIPKYKSPEQR